MKRREFWIVESPTLGQALLDNYEAARAVYASEQVFNGKKAKLFQLAELLDGDIVLGKDDAGVFKQLLEFIEQAYPNVVSQNHENMKYLRDLLERNGDE